MDYNAIKHVVYQTLVGLDGTAAASTAIFTTIPGARFQPISVNIELTSVTGFTLVASLSVGTNGAGYDNILPITALTGLSSANTVQNIPLVAIISSLAASSAIFVKITTGATATTYVLKISVTGIYI